MAYSVANAGSDDVEELAAVAAATFPLASPPHTTAEANRAFIAEHLTPERFAGYLHDSARIVLKLVDGADAESRGPIVGYAMLVEGAPHDAELAAQLRLAPTVELSKFYLLPELHGSGAAGFLMRSTLFAASGLRASAIWLGTNQLNVRAQRFYQKNGFERVGVKQFFVGDHWEDDFVYERALEPHRTDWVVGLGGGRTATPAR